MPVADNPLALPLLIMMLLTLVVWVYMFIRRMGYISSHKLDAELLKSPGDVAQLIPDDVAASGNNLKNLFELPVLFYALCLYLMLVGQVDDIHLYCAWGFVGFRVLHSLIHCSYNTVMHRFGAYFLSALALWVMVVRAFLGAL